MNSVFPNFPKVCLSSAINKGAFYQSEHSGMYWLEIKFLELKTKEFRTATVVWKSDLN